MKILLLGLTLLASTSLFAAVDNGEVAFMKNKLGPGCFAEYVRVKESNGAIVIISKACGLDIKIARNEYNADVRGEFTEQLPLIDGVSQQQVFRLCAFRLRAGAISCNQHANSIRVTWPIFR